LGGGFSDLLLTLGICTVTNKEAGVKNLAKLRTHFYMLAYLFEFSVIVSQILFGKIISKEFLGFKSILKHQKQKIKINRPK
jgi:hypothetical protein